MPPTKTPKQTRSPQRKQQFESFCRSSPTRAKAIAYGKTLGYKEGTIRGMMSGKVFADDGQAGRRTAHAASKIEKLAAQVAGTDDDYDDFGSQQMLPADVDELAQRADPTGLREHYEDALERVEEILAKHKGDQNNDHSIMSREEEGELAEIIQSATLKDANGKIIKDENEKVIFRFADDLKSRVRGKRRAAEAAHAAREKAIWTFVELNERLAHSIARDMRGLESTMYDHDDLLSEANFGIRQAAILFNPAVYKTKFSTYTTGWAKQGVSREATRGKYMMHTKTSAQQSDRVRRAIQEYEAEIKRTAPDEEIAKLTGIPENRVKVLRANLPPLASLDSPRTASESDGGSLSDTVADTNATDPEARAIEMDAAERLRKKLDLLPEPEREAVERYADGETRDQPLSTVERQRAAKGMSKIRHPAMDRLG